MALTSTEQDTIVQLLGHPGIILDPTSVAYDKIFSDRLTTINAQTETRARQFLTQIAAIETQLFAAPTRLIAGEIGDIKINLSEMEGLRKERKKLVKEMAAHLMLPYRGINGPNISAVN